MKIFLSYPSDERSVAERLNLALVGQGHDVFFDRADLAPGLEYNQAIARAIGASDLFVFLITPAAVQAGRYTITELGLAERRWPNPDGRVLPVMLQPTERASLPAYIRAVTIFTPRGDVVADTAHEVARLAGARRLTTRAWRWVRSTSGIITVAGLGALGALALLTRPWEGGMLGARVPRLPPDVRQRARAAAPMNDSGFVIATANPPRLVRFSESGAQIGDPVDLMGEPVSIERTPGEILVVTRAKDGLTWLDAKHLRDVDSVVLDPASVRQPRGLDNPPRRSGDIESVAPGRNGLWVTTGDRDGEPTVLRYRAFDGEWEVVTFNVDTLGFGPDAKGVRLRNINGELWGAKTRGNPSTLYHIVHPFVRVDRFDGRHVKLASCAHDIATSPAGNPIILSCENELQEITTEGNTVQLHRTRPTVPALPTERAPGQSTYEILTSDSTTVVIALNTAREPNDDPVHARVVEVDSSGTATPLLDEPRAVVRSLAVTPRSVVAVLRRAGGASDVVVARRPRRAR